MTLLLSCLVLAPLAAEPLVLENDHVRRVLVEQDGRWRTTQFERATGTGVVTATSNEFAVLLGNGQQVTVDDYVADAPPRIVHGTGQTVVAIEEELPQASPRSDARARAERRHLLGAALFCCSL